MPAKDTSRHPYTSQASQLHPNHSNATNSLVTAGEIQETKPAFRRAKRTFDRRQRMQTWCSTGLMAVLTIVATVFAILQYANGAPDENVIWGQNWEIDKWCKHVEYENLKAHALISTANETFLAFAIEENLKQRRLAYAFDKSGLASELENCRRLWFPYTSLQEGMNDQTEQLTKEYQERLQEGQERSQEGYIVLESWGGIRASKSREFGRDSLRYYSGSHDAYDTMPRLPSYEYKQSWYMWMFQYGTLCLVLLLLVSWWLMRMAWQDPWDIMYEEQEAEEE